MLRIFRIGILAFFCAGGAPELLAHVLEQGTAAQQNSAAAEHKPDLQEIFRRGQAALEQGRLKDAEQDFHSIIAVDPHSAGAYANLGVVYMREKQWKPALAMLHQAQQLSPEVAGIRLNIGLAYYRQNKFQEAIPAFESVVRDNPGSLQGR